MRSPLTIQAGEAALELIRSGAFCADKIAAVAGAAGGPKWFVLSSLDKALFGSFFRNRKKDLSLIGSSIGSWRFAALSQKNPVKAVSLLEQHYMSQEYSLNPSSGEISGEAWKMLDSYVFEKDINYILAHPFIKLNIICARSSFITSARGRIPLLLSLSPVFILNAVSRRSIGLFFSRHIFSTCIDSPIPDFRDGINTFRHELKADNFKKALMASGSIPVAMNGVEGIIGAPDGIYRDGGMTDYHFDFSFPCADDEFLLYPHFTERVVPGWFDKSLFWRKPCRKNFSNAVIVSPSRDFISKLPYGKIPDRNDFKYFGTDHAARRKYWMKAVNDSAEIADSFMDLVTSGKISKAAVPLKGFR